MTLGVSRLPCKYVPFKSSIYRKSLFVRFSNISFCNFVRFSNISRKTTFFSFCILMIHMILVIGRKQMHSTNYYGPFWSKRNLTAYFISDRIKIEKGTTDKRLVQRYMFTFIIKKQLIISTNRSKTMLTLIQFYAQKNNRPRSFWSAKTVISKCAIRGSNPGHPD